MNDRQFKSRLSVVFLIGLIAVLGACASSSTGEQTLPTSDVAPPEIQQAETTESNFAPTREFVEAAAAYIDATPHRYEGFLRPAEGATDAPPGFGDRPVETGEFDGTITSTTIDVSEMFSSEGGEDFFRYTIVDGSMIYQYDPNRDLLLSQFSGTGLAVDEGVLRMSKDRWVVLDWSVVNPGVPIESTASASDLVQGFQVADMIVEGPPSVVRGVATRTIQATIRPADLFAGSDGLEGAFEGTSAELTVHVDAAGVIRRITTTIGGEIERTSEFFDIGSNITIELPDAVDITASLLAEQAAFAASQGTESEAAEPEVSQPEVLQPDPSSILALIEGQPELSTLRSLLRQHPAAVGRLGGTDRSWTLFAPTNDAFALLGDPELAALWGDPDRLADLLDGHMVEGSFDAAALASMTTLETMNGEILEVASLYNLVSDVSASNGVMHIVTNVLPG